MFLVGTWVDLFRYQQLKKQQACHQNNQIQGFTCSGYLVHKKLAYYAMGYASNIDVLRTAQCTQTLKSE